MKKRTILDQIEIKSDGVIFLRLLKQIIDDDGSILQEQPHRSVVEPHVPVADQFKTVNAHLKKMGWPEVSVEEIARFDKHAKLARTPEVVAAYKARLEAAIEEFTKRTAPASDATGPKEGT